MIHRLISAQMSFVAIYKILQWILLNKMYFDSVFWQLFVMAGRVANTTFSKEQLDCS